MARRSQSSLVSRTVEFSSTRLQPAFEVVDRPIGFRSWRHGESLLSVLRGCRGKGKGCESAAVRGGFECSLDAQGRFASAERWDLLPQGRELRSVWTIWQICGWATCSGRGVQRRERGEGAGEEPLLPTNQNIDSWSVNGMPMTAGEILAQCM